MEAAREFRAVRTEVEGVRQDVREKVAAPRAVAGSAMVREPSVPYESEDRQDDTDRQGEADPSRHADEAE